MNVTHAHAIHLHLDHGDSLDVEVHGAAHVFTMFVDEHSDLSFNFATEADYLAFRTAVLAAIVMGDATVTAPAVTTIHQWAATPHAVEPAPVWPLSPPVVVEAWTAPIAYPVDVYAPVYGYVA